MKKYMKMLLAFVCLAALLLSNALLVSASAACNHSNFTWIRSPSQHIKQCTNITCKRTFDLANHAWVYMSPGRQVCWMCGQTRPA